MAFESNQGANKLARVLTSRMKKHDERPLTLDFGSIQENGSLLTNTFPLEIPKGQYTLCRQLTLGPAGKRFCDTTSDGYHEHSHSGIIPEKMRSLKAGDRVLVAWVEDEAVVIDLIVSS